MFARACGTMTCFQRGDFKAKSKIVWPKPVRGGALLLVEKRRVVVVVAAVVVCLLVDTNARVSVIKPEITTRRRNKKNPDLRERCCLIVARESYQLVPMWSSYLTKTDDNLNSISISSAGDQVPSDRRLFVDDAAAASKKMSQKNKSEEDFQITHSAQSTHKSLVSQSAVSQWVEARKLKAWSSRRRMMDE
jgi:hypothetical protein